MYKNYKITDASMNPDNTKGFHVKPITATNSYKRDKQAQEFIQEMTKLHEDNFELISISKPEIPRGFLAEITYNIK